MIEALHEAKEHAEAERYDKAWPLVREVLETDPTSPQALCLASFMLEKQGSSSLAYHVCKQLITLYPHNPTAWLNMGKTCDTLWRMDEAEAAYRRALNCLKPGDEETKLAIFVNLSSMFMQMAQWNKARDYCERALKIDPQHLKSRHNYGVYLLAMSQWSQGWKQYEASVGSPARIAYDYGGEPMWKGEPDHTVAIYGEQGLGDEICAASMYDDAIARAGKVIIDCDSRLAGLFRRSFPKAKVYGTRSKKVLNWDDEDHKVDYSIAAMQLGAIFRTSPETWKPQPYLTADPDQVLMWKALWKAKGKPAVGVAWTGGFKSTGRDLRSVSIEMLSPLLGIDVHFVNLEYKPTDTHGDKRLNTYANVTLAKEDYDQTASLVASLDAVVSVPTTVCHLSGALGVPTIAMKSSASCWKYESGLQFHPRILIENSGDWPATIERAAQALKGVIG